MYVMRCSSSTATSRRMMQRSMTSGSSTQRFVASLPQSSRSSNDAQIHRQTPQWQRLWLNGSILPAAALLVWNAYMRSVGMQNLLALQIGQGTTDNRTAASLAA